MAWRITHIGPDPDKNMLWKVNAADGARETRDLRCVHITGLSEAEARAITPDTAARRYREGLVLR